MNINQEFFLNGFIVGQFKKSKTLNKLNQILYDIKNEKIESGYRLESKYKGTLDLRPNIFSYSDVFTDILFENKIPELINNISTRDNICFHIQLRKTLPSKTSYMRIHRDSYLKSNRVIGNIPPPIKLIYYPSFDDIQVNQLQVKVGSHIKFYKNYYLDNLINSFGKSFNIKSSNNQFLIFNTMIYHKIFPEKLINGSMRLIYSFGTQDYNKKYPDSKHLIDKYIQNRGEIPFACKNTIVND